MKEIICEIEKLLAVGWFGWTDKEKQKAARILEAAAKDLISDRPITDQYFVILLEKLKHLKIGSNEWN